MKKGNKVTDVLGGVKGVYLGEICRIRNINFKSGQSHTYNIEVPEPIDSSFHYDVDCDGIKPLLKFPDKDEEFWSCDLVGSLSEGFMALIYYDGFEWLWATPQKYFENGIEKSWKFFKMEKDFFSDSDGDMLRLCSLYDKEALDHLPEDVVSKLKEIVK